MHGVLDVGQALEGLVDQGVDFLGNLEPGQVSELLPDGTVSVGAVEEKGDGGHADFGVFSLVEGTGHEDRQNLLLNDLVGDDVTGENIER